MGILNFFTKNKELRDIIEISRQISFFEKQREGYLTITNSNDEWMQLLVFYDRHFFLERPASKEEIKLLKESKTKNLPNVIMYYYSKKLSKTKLIKICDDFLNGDLVISKKDWTLQTIGKHKTADGSSFYITSDGLGYKK